jgi:hypothetical protein
VAQRFLTPIDMAGFDVQNAKAHLLSADPSGLTAGDQGLFWFNTTSKRYKVWDGTTAGLKATDSDLLNGQAAAFYLARGNQTGSQVASTISDLAATVKAYRLDEFVAPNIDVPWNSKRITNLLDPSANQDAATKNYVDLAISSLTSGQVIKGSVRAATTANVSITSAPATIDGLTPNPGDIFILNGQTTPTQNGPRVWTAAGAAMNYAANWDTNAEAVLGSYWVVREGTFADTFAVLTNDTAIVLGTSTPTFVFRGQAGATYTGGAGLLLSGTDFSIGAGLGISVLADSIAIDTTVVGRKVVGIIPATTGGIFSVSGSTVTINHGLNNWAARLTARYYTSPPAGGTAGGSIVLESVASDANNIVVTLPAAPGANQYYISIVG